jgi:hypothetical protein
MTLPSIASFGADAHAAKPQPYSITSSASARSTF